MLHPLTKQPVAEFFGRRYLRADELVEIGVARDLTALERLVRAGQFPPPLRLHRTKLWDTVEVAARLEQAAQTAREDTAE
jgi:hypothetical protein